MKILKSVLLVFCFFLQPSVFAQQAVIKDITYKITPENDSVKLDLYFPTNHLFQKTPLVVFIHGGAWVEGNKDHDSIYYMRALRDTLRTDRKSTRLNSSHVRISYAVFCLKKKSHNLLT